MMTVQVALGNREYAESLCHLLRREGRYEVLLPEKPDLKIEGVIVVDAEHLENISASSMQPERFVLITRRDEAQMKRIWDVGISHVVFETDAPKMAQLAINAAELRQPEKKGAGHAASPSKKHRHAKLGVGFVLLSSLLLEGHVHRFPSPLSGSEDLDFE